METKNEIIRQEVESSLLKSVGYNEHTNTLEVEFKSKKPAIPGSVYQYGNITPQMYEDMMDAESIGSFFLNKIKPFADKYPYKKIEEE